MKILEEPPKHPFPCNDYTYATKDLSKSMKTVIEKYICKGIETMHNLKQAIEYVCSLTQMILAQGTCENSISTIYQGLFERLVVGFQLEKNIRIATFSNQVSPVLSTTKSTSMSTKNTNTRCDYLCTLGNVTIIFGEEKASYEDLLKCENQLKLNVGLLMDQFYGDIPFVLCYAVAREQIKFYAFIRRSTFLNFIFD